MLDFFTKNTKDTVNVSVQKDILVASGVGATVGLATNVAIGGIGIAGLGTAIGVGLLGMTGLGIVAGLAGLAIYNSVKVKE